MAVAEAGDVVLTAEKLSISSWPHAVVDCPAAWSSPTSSPCPSCFCFVCDTPFSCCEDATAHAVADGAQEEWRRAKRRRSALTHAWQDIPALVNLIVQLSVDEAARNAGPKQALLTENACGSPTYVGMTAGYQPDKDFVEKDTATLVKGLAGVSLDAGASNKNIVKAEHDANLFAKQEFVKKELVDHVNQELLSHNIVKSEIVSHIVQPGPE